MIKISSPLKRRTQKPFFSLNLKKKSPIHSFHKKLKPSLLVAFFLGLCAGVGFYSLFEFSVTTVLTEEGQIQGSKQYHLPWIASAPSVLRNDDGKSLRPGVDPSHSSEKISSTNQPSVQAYFSPYGGCTKSIVDAIHEAKSSIYVMAYAFTSKPIAAALMEAHGRGVEVKILIDRSQLKAKHTQLLDILQKGIAVFIDSAPGIAHNKVMIFDEKRVLTGSFNFSHGAETKNAENILFIQDPDLAQVYKKNWENRAKSSRQLN